MTQQDVLVMSVLDEMTPFIHRCAVRYTFDYEELYQDASVLIMQAMGRTGINNLGGYVYGAFKYHVWRKVSQRANRHRLAPEMSLESQIGDTTTTLEDLIPSPFSCDPLAIVIAKERLNEVEHTVAQLRHAKKRNLCKELFASWASAL